jgi:hypothetical protein
MSTSAMRVVRFHNDYRWEGVEREAYKSGQEEGRVVF